MTSFQTLGMTNNGVFTPPPPQNEPILDYAPGSAERDMIKSTINDFMGQELEVAMRIGDQAVTTGDFGDIVSPHNHQHRLGRFHKADGGAVDKAIEAALSAQHEWARTPWEDRVAIFLRAAQLLSGYMRPIINAATMLGQSKTVYQAEIDSACELIDFLRFNAYFAHRLYSEQPFSTQNEWNRTDYRPLEGFVYAVTPFNFTAIAGNLPTAPAMLGNTVVWKPASSAMLSAHFIMALLRQSGLPPGVINMVPGSGAKITERVLAHKEFAGLHFTGSTAVFNSMWKTVGENVGHYSGYPRLVGETGGKDFIIAHSSAEPLELMTAIVRGSFEYQGQKCSAASRAYIARSVWEQIEERLIEETNSIKMGDVSDFSNFMGAVIDKAAYDRVTGAIDRAKEHKDVKVIAGGEYSDEVGYFIRPTILLTTDPNYETMETELFGPVLTVYVYADDRYEEILELCDKTSPYGLTGAIFARERQAILKATDRLQYAAGNFYINDKPTGAVVGRQPFGGARASGTNDKAGSLLNLLRWLSPRTIKESFSAPVETEYPHMLEP